MYWRPWCWDVDGWYGAWIGVALPGLLAGVCYWTGLPLGALLMLAGIGAGALVGGRLGERVVHADSSIGIGLRAGLLATALGAAAWYLGLSGWTLLFQGTDFGTRLGQVGFFLLMIALYAVFLGLPIALPVGVGAAALLRAVRQRPRPGTAVLIAASVVAISLGAAAIVDLVRA